MVGACCSARLTWTPTWSRARELFTRCSHPLDPASVSGLFWAAIGCSIRGSGGGVALKPTTPRCPAMAKTTRLPCGHPAGYRTNHNGYGLCTFHGGASPGGERQAERLRATATAQAFGLPVETSAEEALENELWRTGGTVSWLGAYLQGVPAEQRLTGAMAPFAELYASERKHLASVAKACIDVGLDERRVTALETAAQAFADVLRRVLADLGVLDDPRAPEIVRRHLALLGPGDG
jgi:hypothetical protein